MTVVFLLSLYILIPANSGFEDTGVRDVILEKAMESLQAGTAPEEYRYGVKARWIPGHLQKTDPGDILAVEPVGEVKHHTPFDVTVRKGDGFKEVQVQLAVTVEKKIPVPNRRISSGEVIDSGDFERRWVDVTRNRNRIVDKLSEMEGKTLRRTLAPGEAVRYGDLVSEYLIEAGDTVRLIFEEQGLRIEITGEARQSGAKNDKITIYSNETRKKYTGKVVARGIALWEKTNY